MCIQSYFGRSGTSENPTQENTNSPKDGAPVANPYSPPIRPDLTDLGEPEYPVVGLVVPLLDPTTSLRRIRAPAQQIDRVGLDTFCEDLLSSDQLKWADACPVDERTLADLMGEVQDPALRLKLQRLCVELAEVDAHVDDGESSVLVAAVEHWGLHREMFRPSSRN